MEVRETMSKQPFPISKPADFGFSETKAKEMAERILQGVAKLQRDRDRRQDASLDIPGAAPLSRVF